MTPAWAQRQEALLRDCIVSPDVFDHMVERLRDFAFDSFGSVSVLMNNAAISGTGRSEERRVGKEC